MQEQNVDNYSSETHEDSYSISGLDDVISSLSLNVVLVSCVILLILFAVSLLIKKPKNTVKKALFSLVVAVITICTLFLASSTIYLNSVSSSKGPVHWHADFEIYACGSEVELLDPSGLSNKVGTPTLHEHNDKRIHLEGVVVDLSDASLGKFFKVIGGSISSQSIGLPTNEGFKKYQNGDLCPDGSAGVLNVFLYKTIEGIYVQKRLADPSSYVITAESGVPPGDCIIFEFGEYKEKTDKLCRSYKVAEKIGKIRKGF